MAIKRSKRINVHASVCLNFLKFKYIFIVGISSCGYTFHVNPYYPFEISLKIARFVR